MKLGFIGLGNMGFPMAENLLKKEGNLVVNNRSIAKCAPLVEKGAEAVTTQEEVAQKSDIIFLSLPGPAQVEEVVTRLVAAGHEGQKIVDFSTVSPALNRKMAKLAADKGIVYVDVPVSGGPAGAANGKLS